MIVMIDLIARVVALIGGLIAATWLVPSLREKFPKARLIGLSIAFAAVLLMVVMRFAV